MTAIQLLDHPAYTDRLRLRDGRTMTVRFVAPDEGEDLQCYFRKLSLSSRHNRFLGAVSELPASELDRFIHAGQDDRFSVIATLTVDGIETIIGEARYGFEPAARTR